MKFNLSSFQSKVLNATKWSTITEVMAKLVSPLVNMVLARILAPEAFGVIATVTMIISFAEMFADSGFQKYLVQREFKGKQERYQCANVAFWTNFGISILLLAIITLFRHGLAEMVGNPGLGNVLAIASLQLPLTSFSSIQMALFRRDFNFRTLFWVRLIAILIPCVVTIPLALLGFNYWALIIGSLVVQLSNALFLTIKSDWKPRFFYSVRLLKEMLSFSIWSLIEAISIWLTTWIDAFIIGNALNQHYLGLYKTSTTMVNTLMALITASTVPVIFSTLSRLQNDDEKFHNVYFKFQRMISVLVFPLGIGVFFYSDLATDILLGDQWVEASNVIGTWALTSSIQIVFSYYLSEVIRAKGRPKLSFLSQMLHLVVLVPACLISSKFGFWPLVYTRSWIRLQAVLAKYIVVKVALNFPVWRNFKNVLPTCVSAIAMGGLAFVLKSISSNVIWSFASIIICAGFYFALLYAFPSMRQELLGYVKRFISRGEGKDGKGEEVEG